MAVPRIGLPQPLPPSEVAQVRRIFTLQERGSVDEAARETARLPNDLLLGAILADRYQRWRAPAAELAAWLTKFGDQPEAPAIRALLDRPDPAATAGSADLGSSRDGRMTPGHARLLFVQNRDAAALAAGQSASANAEARFAAGLAAVRLNRVDVAVRLFEAAHRAADSSALRAAGAFWTGRMAQRDGDRGRFAVWMRRAAQDDDTFYGQIARRALAPATACATGETLGSADLEALLATPQGRRAFALLQVGEKRLAEAELRALSADTAQDGLFDRPITLVARAAGFVQLAADIVQRGNARPDQGAPSSLRPASGFVVDPPLVYAVVRHESNFRPAAVSHTGARGLMQIMPRTAQAIAGGQASRLHDPAVNLEIGQRLMLVLAEDDSINGDLIRLLAGYGQGQGGLRKWVDAVRDDGDPLMFIEAIPNGMTRAFIEDSLVFSWQYAADMHLPAASLEALAAGRYPRLVRAGESPRNAAGAACARTAAR